PRLGFAWDVLGDGKTKLFGAFGLFYDTMKYEMPRGSFGGDKWKDYVYPLDDPDILKLKAPAPPNSPLSGFPKPFEIVDWRIPSNDPSDNTIDPNLKPMRRRVWDIGLERALSDTMALNVRYTHNSLDRAIEDVGTLGAAGEIYFIANPGFGITVNPKTWDPGFPMTPKAKRNYDAVETRIEKRFSRNYTFVGSYTWSRLWGNYGGLASSDENGRMSPNVNRYFDLPFMSYDKSGKEVLGLLATDRTHSFKFFGSYNLKSKVGATTFGPIFIAQSGTPLTTEVTMVSSTPIFVNGRGDLGRTPVYSQTDFLLAHEFKVSPKHEHLRVKVDMNVTNLFNQATTVNSFAGYLHSNDGQVNFDHEADFFKGFDYQKMMTAQKLRTDPRFKLPNDFLGPRDLRFGLHFYF
ncbi:MAG: hypothetical protein HY822_21970, partial [Acidobacteria bacterium]|nr:hypothetical protein [Acidobacteriota bacterium]